MNERIRKLAEQAGFKPFEVRLDDAKLEKFAELIVQECIETINDRVLNSDGSGDWYKGYCDGAVAACREINQHFGVES
jgi:hypothetical protein